MAENDSTGDIKRTVETEVDPSRGSCEFRPTERQIREAVVAELLEYFADARVDGVALTIYQARYIAGGIVDRLYSQDDPCGGGV